MPVQFILEGLLLAVAYAFSGNILWKLGEGKPIGFLPRGAPIAFCAHTIWLRASGTLDDSGPGQLALSVWTTLAYIAYLVLPWVLIVGLVICGVPDWKRFLGPNWMGIVGFVIVCGAFLYDMAPQ